MEYQYHMQKALRDRFLALLAGGKIPALVIETESSKYGKENFFAGDIPEWLANKLVREYRKKPRVLKKNK